MEGMVLVLASVVAGIAGMLVHFWKKKLREPSFPALRDYILNQHPIYSIMATGVTVVGSVAAAKAVGSIPLDYGALLAYFTGVIAVGTSCDSLINKYVDESGVSRT